MLRVSEKELDDGGQYRGQAEDPPPFPAIQRSPLTDQVVDRITDRILLGQLAPGTRLRQRQLAEELSISRTPLREALRVLQTDGLVEQRQNGTFSVVAPTLQDARDTYEMREVVDAFAARMAALRASPSDIEVLEQLVLRLEATCEPFDPRRYVAAVSEFHVGLLRASGNRTILALETTIRMSTRVLYPRFDHRQERLVAAAREHRRLFNAIRDHDPDEAERCAREHVRAVIKFWIDEDDAAAG